MMTLPTFIGIGAQRGGSTWLYEMLSKHPDIFLTSQKELHFFDEKPDFTGYQGLGKPGRPYYYDMESRKDWQWYEKQFEAGVAYKCRGEITPYYAVLSDQRVAFMARKLPDLKIIYSLRNPVQRAWSGFRLFWFSSGQRKEAQLNEDVLLKTIMHPAKLIHGNYILNMGVYEKCFPKERILYLFYDDIVLKPETVLQKVYRFLKVDSAPPEQPAMREKINSTSPLEMPPRVKSVLENYYADQESFIRQRFNRSLVY